MNILEFDEETMTSLVRDLWGFKEGEGWVTVQSRGVLGITVPFLVRLGHKDTYYTQSCTATDAYGTANKVVDHWLDKFVGHHNYHDDMMIRMGKKELLNEATSN